MSGERYLLVTADDFGIGPDTSRGILDLATSGLLTGTVLLVNSPFAAEGVQAWRRSGSAVELGWHPCLTLDRPVLPAARVPSLVDREGRFWPLSPFVRRLCCGQVALAEVEAELRAQYQRFQDLVGRPPAVVNTHHHVQVFAPVGAVLRNLLQAQRHLPYLRRVREPWRALVEIPGARGKRAFLSLLGRPASWRQERDGFPGNDWLAGITDPPCLADPDFLARWLTRLPGRVIELMCHPGHLDQTLAGRDGTAEDGQLQRRAREFALLRQASFPEACRQAGFTLVSPSAWVRLRRHGSPCAA